MKQGDILLFRDSGLLSKIIGRISGGKYSHVALNAFTDAYTNEIGLIESTWKGIEITTLKKKDYKYVDVFRNINMTDELGYKIVTDAVKHVNKKYDYSLLFTIMLNKWFGIMPIDGKEKFICSEFVDMIYKKNGIDIIPTIKNDNVTPNELAEILINHPEFKKLDKEEW